MQANFNKEKCLILAFVINDISFLITHRLELLSSLSNYHSIHVLTDTPTANPYQLQRVTQKGIILHHIKKRTSLSKPYETTKQLRAIKHRLEQLNPNTCIYVSLENVLFGLLIHLFFPVKKLVLLVTGLGADFTQKNFKAFLLQASFKLLAFIYKFKTNPFFIFQNKHDLEQFCKKSYFKRNQCQLIRGNGIDTDTFKYVKRNTQNPLVFLMAARLVYDKGVMHFYEAAQAIKATSPHIRFVLAGPYNPQDQHSLTKSDFERIQSSKHIEYLGHLDTKEMLKTYYQANAFVLPSYHEGLPKAALEAAATGLPLLLSNIPGCKDCVIQNQNGYLFQPKDSHSLIESLNTLIQNQNKLEALGIASRKLVEQHFSLDKIKADYLDLLNLA